MPDREKVIKGMKMCISPYECSSDDCPYYIRPNNESGLCWDRLMTDALALLKEQEPKTGRFIYKKYDDMFMCSCCEKYSIRNDYPYCHWCGAKMEGR